MKSDPTPYELESTTTLPESELDPSELEPYKELHPYQLATLAARIAPHLCANHSTQLDAVYLATHLIHRSAWVLDGILHERMSWEESEKRFREMVLVPEQAFRERYKLGKTNIAYRRAALLVTGHAEDRHTAVALRQFQKVMDTPDPDDIIDPEGNKWEKERAETLARYQRDGVPVGEVISWRRKAEILGICVKKLLTRHLWKVPENLRNISERSARGAAKDARRTPKPARGPTKKRGKSP
jgi:hypothetical protein